MRFLFSGMIACLRTPEYLIEDPEATHENEWMPCYRNSQKEKALLVDVMSYWHSLPKFNYVHGGRLFVVFEKIRNFSK